MPTTFFEDATVTITANLTRKKVLRTKPYSGPAKLNFYKADAPAPFFTSTVSVVDGNLDRAFTKKIPLVEKTEPYYDLRVTCEYKKTNKPVLSASIWPKQVDVLFKDPGGKPMKNFNFQVRQRDEFPQTLTTDDQGKCTATLLARAPYSIVPAGRYLVHSDEQASPGQFRNHVIVVERAVRARFESPDLSKPHYIADTDKAPAKKQWINLKSKEKEHDPGRGGDAKGSTIVVSVTADPPENGQPGDRVYFEINFSKEGKRNLPAPGLLPDFPVNDKKVNGNKTTGFVVLAPMGEVCTGYFEIELGVSGGDTCEVKIGGTPDVSDAIFKLINWRKLYCQVTKAATATVPALAPVVTSLKKVFIDFEECKADEVSLAEKDMPPHSYYPKTVLKGPSAGAGKSLVIGDHNVDTFENKLNPRFKKDSLPVVHLVYCDDQIDADKPSVTGTITVDSSKVIAYPNAGNVVGIRFSGNSLSGDDSGYIFPKDLRNNTSGVKTLNWTEDGGAGNGTITDADYTFEYSTDFGNRILIRLPAAARNIVDGGGSVSIDIDIPWAEGDNNGWCTDRNTNVIALGRADVDICATIIHEIGHAINQTTPASEAGAFPGLTPPHTRWYDSNRGHSGNHCADGLDDKTYKKQSNMMNTSAVAQVCSCIMYGSTASRANKLLDFCSRCVPFVNAAKIESISS